MSTPEPFSGITENAFCDETALRDSITRVLLYLADQKCRGKLIKEKFIWGILSWPIDYCHKVKQRGRNLSKHFIDSVLLFCFTET